MKYQRCAFSAAAFNGQIYVVGGSDFLLHFILNLNKIILLRYDGSKILQEVDRYDPVTDSWTSLKNMNYGRYDYSERFVLWFICRALASLVVSCGKIFAVGGLSEVKPLHVLSNSLSSVEMYHPETNSWEMRMPME